MTLPSRAALPRVLFVDDEQRVLNSMRMMFRHRFELFLATDARAALEILERVAMNVIVADQQMPETSGIELLAAARARWPWTRGILMTEYSDLGDIEDAIRASDVFQVIVKPCAPSRLRAVIELASEVPLADQAAADPDRALIDEILSEEPIVDPYALLAARGAGGALDVADVIAEIELAANRVLDMRPANGNAPAVDGVLVFSADRAVVRCVEKAAAGRFPVLEATNIVRVVQLLDSHEPAVLVTDVVEDRDTLEAMVDKLRQHRPDLAVIAILEHLDPVERAWLINRGLVFRFLRKPASPGRCAVALQAALKHVGAQGFADAHAPAAGDSGAT